MSNYATGARIERLARDVLRRYGYYVVRSAGSKGAFDLVAWNKDEIKFIQCKKVGAWSKADLEKMVKVPIPCIDGVMELWEWDGSGDWQVHWFDPYNEVWDRRSGTGLK